VYLETAGFLFFPVYYGTDILSLYLIAKSFFIACAKLRLWRYCKYHHRGNYYNFQIKEAQQKSFGKR
jgi:hypothetical protein